MLLSILKVHIIFKAPTEYHEIHQCKYLGCRHHTGKTHFFLQTDMIHVSNDETPVAKPEIGSLRHLYFKIINHHHYSSLLH